MMNFDLKTMPDNQALKKLFQWRGRLVIDTQVENLLNKIGDEICFRAEFLTCMRISQKAVIKDGRAVLPEGTQITFFTVQNKNGDRFLPVFTDEEGLSGWRKDGEHDAVGMRFDDFSPILKANRAFAGIVINPQTDNFMLPAQVVEQWTARKKKVLEFAAKQRELMQKAADMAKAAGEQKAADMAKAAGEQKAAGPAMAGQAGGQEDPGQAPEAQGAGVTGSGVSGGEAMEK